MISLGGRFCAAGTVTALITSFNCGRTRRRLSTGCRPPRPPYGAGAGVRTHRQYLAQVRAFFLSRFEGTGRSWASSLSTALNVTHDLSLVASTAGAYGFRVGAYGLWAPHRTTSATTGPPSAWRHHLPQRLPDPEGATGKPGTVCCICRDRP